MVVPHQQSPKRFHPHSEAEIRVGYYFDGDIEVALLLLSLSGGSYHAELDIVIPIESGSEHLWQMFDSDNVLAPNLADAARLKAIEYYFSVG